MYSLSPFPALGWLARGKNADNGEPGKKAVTRARAKKAGRAGAKTRSGRRAPDAGEKSISRAASANGEGRPSEEERDGEEAAEKRRIASVDVRRRPPARYLLSVARRRRTRRPIETTGDDTRARPLPSSICRGPRPFSRGPRPMERAGRRGRTSLRPNLNLLRACWNQFFENSRQLTRLIPLAFLSRSRSLWLSLSLPARASQRRSGATWQPGAIDANKSLEHGDHEERASGDLSRRAIDLAGRAGAPSAGQVGRGGDNKGEASTPGRITSCIKRDTRPLKSRRPRVAHKDGASPRIMTRRTLPTPLAATIESKNRAASGSMPPS